MTQLLAKHPIKMTLATLGAILFFVFGLSGKIYNKVAQIDINKKNITTMQESIDMIPTMSLKVSAIKQVIDDNFETKPKH